MDPFIRGNSVEFGGNTTASAPSACCGRYSQNNGGVESVEYIDGDTRLTHTPVAELKKMFIAQLGHMGWLDSKRLVQQAEPFVSYFTEKNLEYICSQIARVLEHLFPGEKFVVPMNAELAQAVVQIAVDNPGLACAPGHPHARAYLTHLNKQVVETEAKIQHSSFIQKKLYYKYILEADRIKTLPYGEYTRSTKGEVTMSTSDYLLRDPRARHRNSYMEQAEGMRWCDKTLAYERIPHYLMPTTKRLSNTDTPLIPSKSYCF